MESSKVPPRSGSSEHPERLAQNRDSPVACGLRRFLCFIYIIGALGIFAELALTGHIAGIWQRLPIVLIVLSFVVLSALACFNHRWPLRMFQFNMILILVCAVLGIWLHFDGKTELTLGIDSSLSGWDLIWECLNGHTLPPVLAPGSMILLGLIGIAFSYKHPVLLAEQFSKTEQNE